VTDGDAPPETLSVLPVDGIGEVAPGDDLAVLVSAAIALHDDDILVVTSKAVSKAEGQVQAGTRDGALAGQTDRVVARRAATSIVRTPHGLVLAAGGIDASNTARGTVVLLPVDPDASARRMRESLAADPGGRNVAVLVSDTAGRAWRRGQTDIAIGAAGIDVLLDHAGRTDRHGNELAVTAPAVADELAAAADLVKRKLDGRPAAVVRGLGSLVLPPGEHGPGAGTLVRDEAEDMFGLGAREAVLAALQADDPRGFGAPSTIDDLADALRLVASGSAVHEERGGLVVALDGAERERGALEARVVTVAFAHGWRATFEPTGSPASVRLRPRTP
jgi:coenzyme F420-0:L-glutamate ligase / coenzyme F420-1:gamma-L-glutamate ligase